MTSLQGEVLEDLLHMVEETLLEGGGLGDLRGFPFLVIAQPIDVHTIKSLPAHSQTASTITVTPPPGKVWKILLGSFIFSADSNVADRTVEIYIKDVDEDARYQRLFCETVQADGYGQYQLGTPAPSANACTYDYLDAQPILAGGMSLIFTAGSMEAGDTLAIRLQVEEWTNYAP